VIHTEPRFDGILGHSAALTAVLTQLELVAPTDATVLLKAFIAGTDINEFTQVTAVEAEKSRRYGQDVLVLRRRSDSARRCSHA